MIPNRRAWMLRGLRLAALCLIPLASNACGTWSDPGGRREIHRLGGSLPPFKDAYDVTPESEIYITAAAGRTAPAWVDLRRDGVVPPVKNQRWNSCVGWALGYFVMTALEARHQRLRGGWLDMSKEENYFSPDYIYSQRDKLALRNDVLELRAAAGDPVLDPQCVESDDPVGCMRPEVALGIVVAQGCCPWTWLCREGGGQGFRSCESDTGPVTGGSRLAHHLALTGAQRHRARCYVRFGELGDFRQRTEELIQEWLDQQGTPVAAVVRMKSGWVTFRGENPTQVALPTACGCGLTETRSICLEAGGEDLGGNHMMCIIGYDRNFPGTDLYPETGSFLVVNQWGDKWGDKGYMWIPRAELKKIWVAGYGLLRDETGVIKVPNRPCVQDDRGRFIHADSADGDDVAVNLACPPGKGTVENCTAPLTVTPSATPFEFMPEDEGVPEGPQIASVGDSVGGDDPADWYVFTVEQDGTPVQLQVTTQRTEWSVQADSPTMQGTELRTLAPWKVLEWKLMDNLYRSLGQRDPETGTIETTLCAGTYYVVVRPNAEELYDRLRFPEDPEVAYHVELRRDVAETAPESCANEPTKRPPTPDPVTRTGVLSSGPAAAPLYKVLVRNNTALCVDLDGLPPGVRVQLVGALVGGGTAPDGTGYGSNAHLSEAQSAVAEGEGASLTFTAVSNAHWSVGNPDEHWGEAFVGLRLLEGEGPVDYHLTFSFLGESAEADVQARVGEAQASALADRWLLGTGLQGEDPMPARDAFALIPRWECCRTDRVILEIDHGCDPPQVAVLDDAGVEIPGAETSVRAQFPGRTVVLVTLPQDLETTVWGSVNKPDGTPLRCFQLRLRYEWTLEAWPLVEFSPVAAAHATPADTALLPLDGGEQEDSVGLVSPPIWTYHTPPTWDYFDFFRVPNSCDCEQRVRVVITDFVTEDPEGPFIVLSVWEDTQRRIRASRYYTAYVPLDPSRLELEVQVPAHGEATVMVEGLGLRVGYTISASSVPAGGD